MVYSRLPCSFILTAIVLVYHAEAFSIILMGGRRGKGGLKKNLDGDSNASKNTAKGQEITGVTLPAEGTIKGWQFGEGVRLACANVDGSYYALQGECPRCGFDLWKGDIIADDPGFDNLPIVACPTCSTTFSWKSGKHGPPLKRTGLQAFVGNLAKTATSNEAFKDAKAFRITVDGDGKVYCRDV